MALSKDSPSKSSEPWVLVNDPWTHEDLNQTVQLLVKAHRHGQTDQVMAVMQYELSKLAEGEVTQSMNDSSKRLRDEPSPSAYASPGARTGMSTYHSNASLMTPPPPMPTLHSRDKSEDENSLPPGVQSLQDWGKSLVSFGKHERKKAIYKEMLDDTSSDMMSYKKYLFDHFDSGSPGLRDLVRYMRASGFDYYRDCTGPVIPGSHHVRKFRS